MRAQNSLRFEAPLLTIGQEGGVPLDLLTLLSTRLLIQGSSRSGKSHMLRYLLEATSDKIQQLVIDWEGEYPSLKEAAAYIWVGDLDAGADLPAGASSARYHCRQLMTSGASVVLDLSDLDEDARYDVAALWLDELMHLPKASRRVILVAIDEVDELAPQGAEVPSSLAVRRLVSRGGKRGLVPIVATQRLAKVHKSVAEVGNFLIGRTTNDVDVNRAMQQLGLLKERRGDLEQLPRGTFYAYGPAIGNGRPELVRSPSELRSHHPDVLRGEIHTPPTPDAIAAALVALRNDDRDPDDASRQELIEEVARLKADIKKFKEGEGSDPADIRRAVGAATASLEAELLRTRLLIERAKTYARHILLDAGELPPVEPAGCNSTEKINADNETTSDLRPELDDDPGEISEVLRPTGRVDDDGDRGCDPVNGSSGGPARADSILVQHPDGAAAAGIELDEKEEAMLAFHLHSFSEFLKRAGPPPIPIYPEAGKPPFRGACECGWPLLADGTCSDAECPMGWTEGDEEEEV